LYFYIVALLDRNFAFTWRSFVHLTPIIVFYLIHMPEFSKSIGITTCKSHFGCYLLNKPCSLVFNFSKLLLNTFYLTFTLFTYKALVAAKGSRLGMQDRLNHQWGGVLISAAFALNLFIVFTRLFEVSQIQLFASRLFVINVAATLFVLVFSFVGVNYRNIHYAATFFARYISGVRIKENVVYDRITEVIGAKKDDAEGCGIPAELMDRYEHLVRSSMEDKKLFLEHHLTKSELSKKLKMPEHHLGAVLKARFGKSFNDFINSYRLSELLRKLADSSNDNYTLLGLAYDCGFNSKSTFNRFFKSQMGVTPSEWMRSSEPEVEAV
ncbi:MAG: AraC family transcriptional regulator, partial [Bacteroidales bacterium]|nr:AraC family transcriptional regulator [Bacteroidales bacterium]